MANTFSDYARSMSPMNHCRNCGGPMGYNASRGCRDCQRYEYECGMRNSHSVNRCPECGAPEGSYHAPHCNRMYRVPMVEEVMPESMKKPKMARKHRLLMCEAS